MDKNKGIVRMDVVVECPFDSKRGLVEEVYSDADLVLEVSIEEWVVGIWVLILASGDRSDPVLGWNREKGRENEVGLDC
ncbi:hypothetical protein ACH5RR_018889 [Cinchona calisaya]|uniref:Uncharacterized protein n=1 Tax=Cinchona calisaya TaxID=153742 RepID=A0ABD2ZRD4_9GENT